MSIKRFALIASVALLVACGDSAVAAPVIPSPSPAAPIHSDRELVTDGGFVIWVLCDHDTGTLIYWVSSDAGKGGTSVAISTVKDGCSKGT